MLSSASRAAIFSNALLLLAFCAPVGAQAATLSLPARGPYVIGQTFSLPVYISTRAGETMNAVSATISYPTDKLQFLSVTKGSIITFWTQEPSAAQGAVSFEGGVYNPGWSGTSGSIVTLTFKVLAAGQAPLTFTSADVLANDGKGTNILDAANGTKVTLTPGAAVTPLPVPNQVSSSGISITSSTHPDQNAWYNSQHVKLNWTLPKNASAVRIGYDRSPDALPSVTYEPATTHKDLTLADGVWYFSVEAKTADGWTSASTFRMRIDTVPPATPPIAFPHGATTTDPRPIVTFNTTDTGSGIAYYQVKTAGKGLVQVSADTVKSNPYPLPVQNPGAGNVTVVAYDQAGNAATSTAQFSITGLSAPTIDPLTDLTSEDILEISGTTYPDSRIDAFLQNEKGKQTTQWSRTSVNGAFRIIWKYRLAPGIYTLTMQTTDDRGARSDISDPVTFKVSRQPLSSLGWQTLNVLSLLLLALVLLLSFGFGGMYLWHRLHRVRRHILHRADPIHRALHREFEDLKDAMAVEIASLEGVRTKRELTQEEARILERLTALVDKSERVIEREMDAIRAKRKPSSIG